MASVDLPPDLLHGIFRFRQLMTGPVLHAPVKGVNTISDEGIPNSGMSGPAHSTTPSLGSLISAAGNR
jgi:hypothetical protein